MNVPSPAGQQVDNMRGLALMALAMFVFSAVDTQAKFLTQTMHPIQVTWSRQLGLFAAMLFLLARHGPSVLKTAHPWLQVFRGCLAAVSAVCFIVAVSFVPLADAVSISFIAPFIVTLLSAFILRETVGIRRWAAVTIGFLGTLIVIRPGMGVVDPAIFFVVLAAFCFALRQIVSRSLANSDRTITTVAYTALVSVVLLTLPLPFVWQTPTTGIELILLLGVAAMAGVGEFTLIKALEVGQAAVVAPVQYSLLLWSTFYGWLIFNDLPDFWTWVGALIIVSTGLYTLHRERLAAKASKARTG
ncbi:DMT family transporter [Psychromarinibacter halotolerans]|uniref:DMT family transporter n=2 Tax=Psychromarinibacter halotolerans TaxID=1775175 RepID=A0ABV7GRV9_9RHOB|nr:DMT family transporter [Psychromarinibacter halotolerans]MDF0597848.1 DMT family transporter [Psychromarinibacter halotolerans]